MNDWIACRLDYTRPQHTTPRLWYKREPTLRTVLSGQQTKCASFRRQTNGINYSGVYTWILPLSHEENIGRYEVWGAGRISWTEALTMPWFESVKRWSYRDAHRTIKTKIETLCTYNSRSELAHFRPLWIRSWPNSAHLFLPFSCSTDVITWVKWNVGMFIEKKQKHEMYCIHNFGSELTHFWLLWMRRPQVLVVYLWLSFPNRLVTTLNLT